MIAIRKLRHRFGDFQLDVDEFQVESGTYAVVLGPSGSGKSLLLKSIAGLYRPRAIRLEIGERDVRDLPPEARRLGLVFQDSALFPHRDVAGNIDYGLRAYGVPRAKRRSRVLELCEELGLNHLLSRSVDTLSGGERQKVALARALAVRPKVLLLDEPLSQVDHHARLELQDLLARVHREGGLTTIHVTHDHAEAFSLADTCALMLGGRFIQADRPDRLRDAPACAFVSSFLGLPPGESDSTPENCGRSCLSGGRSCDNGKQEVEPSYGR